MHTPITIVKCGPFECHYCSQAEPAARELPSSHPDVRHAWRHPPLSDAHLHCSPMPIPCGSTPPPSSASLSGGPTGRRSTTTSRPPTPTAPLTGKAGGTVWTHRDRRTGCAPRTTVPRPGIRPACRPLSLQGRVGAPQIAGGHRVRPPCQARAFRRHPCSRPLNDRPERLPIYERRAQRGPATSRSNH